MKLTTIKFVHLIANTNHKKRIEILCNCYFRNIDALTLSLFCYRHYWWMLGDSNKLLVNLKCWSIQCQHWHSVYISFRHILQQMKSLSNVWNKISSYLLTTQNGIYFKKKKLFLLRYNLSGTISFSFLKLTLLVPWKSQGKKL